MLWFFYDVTFIVMSHPSCVHVQFYGAASLQVKPVKKNVLKTGTNSDPNGKYVGEFTFKCFSDKVLPDCVTVVPGKDPKIFRVKLPTAKPLNLLLVRASTQRRW